MSRLESPDWNSFTVERRITNLSTGVSWKVLYQSEEDADKATASLAEIGYEVTKP